MNFERCLEGTIFLLIKSVPNRGNSEYRGSEMGTLHVSKDGRVTGTEGGSSDEV